MASATFPGCSEGINQLAFSGCPEATAGPQGVATHDEIDRTAKNLRQFAPDATDLKGAEQRLPARRPLVEVDHHVDIAVGCRRVARDGTEQVDMQNPESGEALAVFTQTSQGFIAAHNLIYQEKGNTSSVNVA